MPGCDNNCDAVADLYEASVNAIAYSKLFNSWLNGDQNATVNIGGVSTPTLRNLAMSIKQLVGVWPDGLTIKIDPATKKIYVPLKPNGGVHVGAQGLYVDSNDFIQLGGGLARDPLTGDIYVDFSQMPTDKIEAIMKSLRLPIWVSGNTNWYVNFSHANASDSTNTEADEGRGQSASKPFKTPQACAKYLADNYNMLSFIATINVAAGTYAPVSLGEFSRTTGYIRFKGVGPTTIIKRENLGFCASISGGYWRFEDFKISHAMDYTGVTEKNNNYAGGFSCTGGTTVCSGIDLSMTQTGVNASGRAKTYVGYLTRAGAALTVFPGATQGKIAVNFVDTDMISRYAFAAEGGDMTFGALADETLIGDVLCSGDYTTFCRATARAYVARSQSQINKLAFSGSCTGKRYNCGTGGAIATSGAGPDYFPGDVAGTVDTATGCFYQ